MKNNFHAFQVLAAALIAFATPGLGGLACASEARARTVQLGCMSPNFASVNENPVAAIAAAVAKNKSAPRFRVTWLGSLGGGRDDGTMLYNRRRGTLKFYNIGGDEDTFYRTAYLFTHVSDALLLGLSRKFNTVDYASKLNPRDSLPSLLQGHGCHVHKLIDVTRHLPQPQRRN